MGRPGKDQNSDGRDPFWAQVNKCGPCHDQIGECWLWTGTTFKDRNGGIRYGRFRERKAHRHAWELAVGPVPAGLYVLHRCDNMPCVRPSHLFLGTARENMRDRDVKGRQARGEHHGRSVLSADDVAAIRAAHRRGCPINGARPLARRFNVTNTAIRYIIAGRNWKA